MLCDRVQGGTAATAPGPHDEVLEGHHQIVVGYGLAPLEDEVVVGSTYDYQ